LWTILERLQVNMLANSSRLNLCKHFQRKTNHILESWKWLNNFTNNSQIKSRCLTCNMKPPHCLTRKCHKHNQLLSSWIALSAITLEEYHQDRIVAYRTFASSKDVTFLYLKHKALCHFCNSNVITYFCVYQIFESNGTSKFVPYQPSS